MAVYCISYTLTSKNYDKLHEAIKSYSTWWHNSESVWFIETNENSKIIMDNLKSYLSDGDKLIVIEVKKNWWAIGYSENEYAWLKQRNII